MNPETQKNFDLLKNSELGNTQISMFEDAVNPKNGYLMKSISQTFQPQYLRLSEAIERVMHGGNTAETNPKTRSIVGEIREATKFILQTNPEEETKPTFETEKEKDDWYLNQMMEGVIPLSRQLHNKKVKKKNLKESLPSIVYGGTFKTRTTDNLVEHSGLMCVDFDDFDLTAVDGDPRKTEDYKKLKSCPEVLFIFVSPSGDGCKGVVRIPKCNTAAEHSLYFKAFSLYNSFTKAWDKSTCDVTRVCFESYDPNPYINPTATVFKPDLDIVREEIKESEVKEAKEKALLTGKEYKIHANKPYEAPLFALTDDDKIIKILMSNYDNWNTSFTDNEKHMHVLYTASIMCSKGVSEKSAAKYINKEINCGKVSNSHIVKIVSDAYANKKFKYEPFEDRDKKNTFIAKLRTNSQEVYGNGELSQEKISKLLDEINSEFWYIEKQKKEEEKGKIKIIIKKYIAFLHKKGFARYYPDNKGGEGESSKYIRIINSQVSFSSSQEIRDYVLNYLDTPQLSEVWEVVSTYFNLFHDKILLLIPSLVINPLSDSEKVSNLPTPKGIVRMTPTGKEFIKYEDTNVLVWKHLNKGEEFTIVENDDNDFKQLIRNISGEQPLPFETAIGYACHQFKTDYENKAILLFDSDMSDDPQGGRCKGLIYKGIQKFRNTAYIDGKRINEKSNYVNQTLEETDNVVFLDDVVKGFDLELYFPFLTEGITIRKLYSQPILIPHYRSPKLMISSNYWISGTGNSHKRRRFELELNDHYGEHHQPIDDFGHSLFSGWDEEHWNRFYNYMANCVVKYLKHGLVEQTNAKCKLKRKLLAETNGDFLDWIEDEENFPMHIRLTKQDYYKSFRNTYTNYGSLTPKRFTQWVQQYAEYKGCKFDSGKSNNIRWFNISDTKINTDKTDGKVVNLMDSIKENDAQKTNEDDIFDYISQN